MVCAAFELMTTMDRSFLVPCVMILKPLPVISHILFVYLHRIKGSFTAISVFVTTPIANTRGTGRRGARQDRTQRYYGRCSATKSSRRYTITVSAPTERAL